MLNLYCNFLYTHICTYIILFLSSKCRQSATMYLYPRCNSCFCRLIIIDWYLLCYEMFVNRSVAGDSASDLNPGQINNFYLKQPPISFCSCNLWPVTTSAKRGVHKLHSEWPCWFCVSAGVSTRTSVRRIWNSDMCETGPHSLLGKWTFDTGNETQCKGTYKILFIMLAITKTINVILPKFIVSVRFNSIFFIVAIMISYEVMSIIGLCQLSRWLVIVSYTEMYLASGPYQGMLGAIFLNVFFLILLSKMCLVIQWINVGHNEYY